MQYVLILCLLGCALGHVPQVQDNVEDNWVPREQVQVVPSRSQESPAAAYLGLSAGATQTVPNIRTTFSCIGRRYGYFADVDNNCQIFHVCHPSTSASGEPVIYHFSKFCPANTRFDQRQLTCVSETSPSLISCGDSVRYYPLVENRFAEVPVVQQGFAQTIPQLIQQTQEPIQLQQVRLDTYPTKGVQTVGAQTISNVGIPTKNIVRSEPLTQPIVQQQLVTPIQYQRNSVAQSVPVVTQYVQSNPVQNTPVQNVASIPSYIYRYQPVPQAVQQPAQQLISPAAKQRSNTVQQPIQVSQPVLLAVQQPAQAVQQSVQGDQRIEQQPGQLPLIQPQTVSVVQSGLEQRLDQVQQPLVQPNVQSVVQQPIIQSRDDTIVQRPSSLVSPLNERHREFVVHTSA